MSNATDESQTAAIQGGNGSEVQNEGITGMASAVAREGKGVVVEVDFGTGRPERERRVMQEEDG